MASLAHEWGNSGSEGSRKVASDENLCRSPWFQRIRVEGVPWGLRVRGLERWGLGLVYVYLEGSSPWEFKVFWIVWCRARMLAKRPCLYLIWQRILNREVNHHYTMHFENRQRCKFTSKMLTTLTLGFKISEKLFLVWSLGPKTSKYVSLQPEGNWNLPHPWNHNLHPRDAAFWSKAKHGILTCWVLVLGVISRAMWSYDPQTQSLLKPQT